MVRSHLGLNWKRSQNRWKEEQQEAISSLERADLLWPFTYPARAARVEATAVHN